MGKKKRKAAAYNTHWQTRDGRLLDPEEMETSHIRNALNMLIRVGRRAYLERAMNSHRWSLDALAYASSAPDGAAMAAESASEEFSEDFCRFRVMAFDNHACRALIIKNFPVTKVMEQIYLRRIRENPTA